MRKHQELKIVCLGGGVGTVQLLRGLRKYSTQITVVCSMADDGGSGGRLRRLYSVPPPGDLINCLAALSDAEPVLKELLTFRFSGEKYNHSLPGQKLTGSDHALPGQKLGNLILVALTKITGDFDNALIMLQRIFSGHGKILPATIENVAISAKTVEGKIIRGEEKIDCGEYTGIRALTNVYIEPKNAHTPSAVKVALREADVIIAGPGDLYTTILPVLLVPEIKEGIEKSKADKIFVLNIANKPFETPSYKVSDYLAALERHLGKLLFDCILVNDNFRSLLPKSLNYQYVKMDKSRPLSNGVKVVQSDLVEREFPLYHNPQKLARAVWSVL
ncbi:MAG: YvcK family protein [bacterium]|nr:YvcK family protein [bacterium]